MVKRWLTRCAAHLLSVARDRDASASASEGAAWACRASLCCPLYVDRSTKLARTVPRWSTSPTRTRAFTGFPVSLRCIVDESPAKGKDSIQSKRRIVVRECNAAPKHHNR